VAFGHRIDEPNQFSPFAGKDFLLLAGEKQVRVIGTWSSNDRVALEFAAKERVWLELWGAWR
jgi:hypothetical protein